MKEANNVSAMHTGSQGWDLLFQTYAKSTMVMLSIQRWYLCVCVFVCVRPFTVKASSVWISWSTREQINDVVLKTFVSYAKSLHRYFRMNLRAFLTSYFILLTHLVAGKAMTKLVCVSLSNWEAFIHHYQVSSSVRATS